MKTRFQLISNLRSLFGVLRVLTAIVFLASPLPLLAIWLPGDIVIGTVHVTSPVVALKPAADGSTRPAQISNLRGDLRLPAKSAAVGLPYQIAHTVTGMIHCAFAFVILTLLWRICRNVEQGELFTHANLKSFRRMGIATVTFTFVRFGLSFWTDASTRAFVQDQLVAVQGVQIAPTSLLSMFTDPYTSAVFFDVDGLVTGLLIIALSEVFRRGLELQEEAALTV